MLRFSEISSTHFDIKQIKALLRQSKPHIIDLIKKYEEWNRDETCIRVEISETFIGNQIKKNAKLLCIHYQKFYESECREFDHSGHPLTITHFRKQLENSKTYYSNLDSILNHVAFQLKRALAQSYQHIKGI